MNGKDRQERRQYTKWAFCGECSEYVDNTEEKNLEIYNSSGKLIKSIGFNEKDIFIYKKDLKVAGEYFFNIKLKNGKVIHSGRFIME